MRSTDPLSRRVRTLLLSISPAQKWVAPGLKRMCSRRRTPVFFSNFVIHLTIATTTNSNFLSLMCPKIYYLKPNSELLMRHDESGTEVCTLENPHLASAHYCALKRAYAHNMRLGVGLLRKNLKEEILPMCPLIWAELESPRDTIWNQVVKGILNRMIKHGVYGGWDEMPSRQGPILVNEFLPI